MEIKLRKYMKSALPELVQILNGNYKDYGDFDYAYEFVPYTRETFRSKVVQRYPTILVAANREVKGFITLYKEAWGNGIGIFSVKQSPMRKEIEDLLLSGIEQKAESGRIVVTLTSGSYRLSFFQQKGYKIYGGLYHMTKDLKEVFQAPKLDERITLRSLDRGEEEMLTRDFYLRGVDRVLYHRFQPGFLETWREMDPSFTLDWIRVAEADGKIVSVACALRDNEYNKHFNANRAVVGPLITVPEYRRKGIAKALMCQILNFLITQKIKTATLKVSEGNLPALSLYKSLGFTIMHHWRFLRKDLTEGKG